VESSSYLLDTEEQALSTDIQTLVYFQGGKFKARVVKRSQNRIFLTVPKEKDIRLEDNALVCIRISLEDDRILLMLLDYQGRVHIPEGYCDLYLLLARQALCLWPDLYQQQMHAWCDLRVFEVATPKRILLEDRVFLVSLSKQFAGAILSDPLPLGAFAECTLPFGEKQVATRVMLSRLEAVRDGLFYKAQFHFIDPAFQQMTMEYLIEERAKRMRAAGSA